MILPNTAYTCTIVFCCIQNAGVKQTMFTDGVEFLVASQHCSNVLQLASITADALLLTGNRATLRILHVGFSCQSLPEGLRKLESLLTTN